MKEDRRGGNRRQGETEEDRKARLALRLGRRALGTAIREGRGRREKGRKEGREKGWMRVVINASSMRSGWRSRGCELLLVRN